MTDTLNDMEKQVIALIQEDMPIVERPYQQMADQLGMPESKLLDILYSLAKRGIIRRFGATLRHQQSGYKANVMVAWQVDEEKIQEIGKTMASFNEVSHCYRRDPTDQWPYNLYTMVHSRNKEGCRKTVAKMAAKSGVTRYAMLFSRRELKKTSMKYFSNDTAKD